MPLERHRHRIPVLLEQMLAGGVANPRVTPNFVRPALRHTRFKGSHQHVAQPASAPSLPDDDPAQPQQPRIHARDDHARELVAFKQSNRAQRVHLELRLQLCGGVRGDLLEFGDGVVMR